MLTARPGVRPTAEGLEPRALLSVPAGFAETVVATGLNSPTSMAVAPDGRAFVALQNGNVRVVKNGALLPASFVNVREDSREERGLLGITLDPAFAANHYIYLYYTKLDASPLVAHNVVSRFTADGDVAAGGLAGEQVLFELPDVGGAIWHMGGALCFGPDGRLYVGVGDHMQPDQAQSLASPFGKMLRINPDGSIPADNPFYDQATGVNRAVWAFGLRNPFSAAFEPDTGRLFINDVGSGRAEEVDEGAAGRNFGWPLTEGEFDAAELPAFTEPFYAYQHHGDAACVVGGAFYQEISPAFPQAYRGKYFFADFSQGWVRTLDPKTGAVSDFGGGFGFPVAAALGPDGALWVLTHDQTDGGTFNAGVLRRVEYTLAPPPAAVAGGCVFYNSSAFDGRDAAANAADDAAIAPDKAALAPGRAATFANVTSYARGINGVMVDVRGAWRNVGVADFQLEVGHGNSWSAARAPSAVSVRLGAGAAGSDRVTLTWPDGAVRNTWLRVTVKATPNTGLARDEVFSFGNLVGETGDGPAGATPLKVNARDVVALRRGRVIPSAAALTSAYDFNRDGRVNALDLAVTRSNLSRGLSLPGAGAGAVAAAALAGTRAATDLLREPSRE
jgi:glucose/arabinose dehydrogenase